MYVFIIYIFLFLLVVLLASFDREGYFTFYKGMPGIPKTYVSPHFIRNPACCQDSRVV